MAFESERKRTRGFFFLSFGLNSVRGKEPRRETNS